MKKGPSITKKKKEHKEAFLLNYKFLNKLYVKGYASCFATLDNRIQKFSLQVESILLDEQIICPTFWEHPSPRERVATMLDWYAATHATSCSIVRPKGRTIEDKSLRRIPAIFFSFFHLESHSNFNRKLTVNAFWVICLLFGYQWYRRRIVSKISF